MCAVVMSDVLMTGLDVGQCPYSCCVKQQWSNLIAFFALPPLDNCQQIEHLLEARDPTVRRLICELLPCFICVHAGHNMSGARLFIGNKPLLNNQGWGKTEESCILFDSVCLSSFVFLLCFGGIMLWSQHHE